jgi:hypothetical protein
VPTARIAHCFSTNDCVHCKKSDHFHSQIHQEKSIFERTIGAQHFVGCHFPFKRVQQWPSMPTARIACCFSTNEFLLEIHMVSGAMLVKGYSLRQQTAIVVLSEYLPSFKMTWKSKSTREE